MKVNKISLKNFRNYESLELSFDSSINIFIGENAQGKTNLIEAIYLCAFAKSFRRQNSAEMIMHEKNQCSVTVNAERDEIDKKISITIDSSGKKMVRIDNKPIKKMTDLLNNLVVVAFTPDDLSIIKASPDVRRSFIDRELSQIKTKYHECLRHYNEALKQKNSILKEKTGRIDFEMLDVFDEQLSQYGEEIIKYRKRFIDLLTEKAGDIHRKISGNREELVMKYKMSHDEKGLYEAIVDNRERDLTNGYSSVGPHRDDMDFYINGRDAKKYGSQGQQRTIALSLKLAEIEIARDEIKENPVLLLDDVLSELDPSRQGFLLNGIENTQIFITTTEIKSEFFKKMKNAGIFKVSAGCVEKER